jgi:hypothetical protein
VSCVPCSVRLFTVNHLKPPAETVAGGFLQYFSKGLKSADLWLKRDGSFGSIGRNDVSSGINKNFIQSRTHTVSAFPTLSAIAVFKCYRKKKMFLILYPVRKSIIEMAMDVCVMIYSFIL